MDLKTLEYPRWLHRLDGPSVIVRSDDEAATALADGWSLVYVSPEEAAARAEAEPVAPPVTPPVPVAATKKGKHK